LVRLKEFGVFIIFKNFLISIPFGAIKSCSQ